MFLFVFFEMVRFYDEVALLSAIVGCWRVQSSLYTYRSAAHAYHKALLYLEAAKLFFK